jgi:hypothetical protein
LLDLLGFNLETLDLRPQCRDARALLSDATLPVDGERKPAKIVLILPPRDHHA